LRITLSHDRPPQELKQAVDRSLDDLLRGIVVLPVQLLDLRKTWEGNRLAFSFVAKMGLVNTPIKGSVDISERDITIDVDLGVWERLIPAAKVREAVTHRVRGLLKS
jgi:hypothetical protein